MTRYTWNDLTVGQEAEIAEQIADPTTQLGAVVRSSASGNDITAAVQAAVQAQLTALVPLL